jgi:hypothetical protein
MQSQKNIYIYIVLEKSQPYQKWREDNFSIAHKPIFHFVVTFIRTYPTAFLSGDGNTCINLPHKTHTDKSPVV